MDAFISSELEEIMTEMLDILEQVRTDATRARIWLFWKIMLNIEESIVLTGCMGMSFLEN